MKGKKFLAFSLTVAMLAGGAMSVSAAGVSDVFSAGYYADNYSDLKTAFGTDAAALLQHFMTSGAKEGRVMSPILDVVAYRNAYADLNAAFGDNWDAYVDHYLTNGIKEKRMAGVKFDLVDYAEKNPDVKAAFGEDYAAVARHYLECGIKEGRKGGQIVKESPAPAAASTGSSGSAAAGQPSTPAPTAPQTTAHYHAWGKTPIDSLAPTCTKSGYELYQCTQMVTVTYADGTAQVQCSATWKKELDPQHKRPEKAEDINTICATCTQEGEEHYTCPACGKHVDNVLKKLDHTWVYTGAKKVSTCAEKGWDEQKCSVCGITRKVDRDTLPHDIGKWNIIKEADCMTTGLKKAACATCYSVFEEVIPITDSHANEKVVTVYTDAYADHLAEYHTVQKVTYCEKCSYITKVEILAPEDEACTFNELGTCTKCKFEKGRHNASATKIYHVGEKFDAKIQ